MSLMSVFVSALCPLPSFGGSGMKGKDNPSDFEIIARLIAGFCYQATDSLPRQLPEHGSKQWRYYPGDPRQSFHHPPLLRGASRRIFLESLTQSERSLLADARRLEQFRQGFSLDVAIGANLTSCRGQ